MYDGNQSLNSWYDFERGRAILNAASSYDNMTPYPSTDINFSVHYLLALNGAEIIEIGKTSLASVTLAPTSGYISGSQSQYNVSSTSVGMVYVIKTRNGKYAKMRIISATSPYFRADIVYQPNGTRILQ